MNHEVEAYVGELAELRAQAHKAVEVTAEVIQNAVAEELEACAKVAENEGYFRFAALIRARGTQRG